MKKIILFFLFLIFSYLIYGQLSQGGIPYSLQLISEEQHDDKGSYTLSKDVPIFEMPHIEQSIIEELRNNNNKGQENFQFAYSFDITIDVKKSAIKDSIDCGFLYRLAIKSSDAYSINVIFSEYYLPPGANLFMYNENYEHIIGAFTSNNNKEDKILAVSPVAGEIITIEYFEPYFSDFSGSLIIERISHDFLDILNSRKKNDRGAGPCQVDINCFPEGDNWQIEKRAVCLIMFNGNALCSGALINNTNNDGRAYFLTANHCINTQSRASKCIFYFNYEKPSCKSGSGSLSQSISGATLRANGYDSDFSLVELSKIPLSTFRPYFAGWNRSNSHGVKGVGIHHPQGDVKKISTFDIFLPLLSDCFTDRPSENFYKITWIATPNGHGCTEKVSSGSPLFNSEKRIIGQLFGPGNIYICPSKNCDNPGNAISNYGKIYSSWNLGASSSRRLKDWLDPNSQDVYFLDGIDACPTGTVINLNLNNTISSGTTIYQATNNIESTSIIQSGATVKYEAGNSIILKPGFQAYAGSNFQAKIDENLKNCVKVPDPINLVAWTNTACIGDGLHFSITNATTYTVKIYTSSGSLVYSGSGNIVGNSVTVWSAGGVAVGYYGANITFSSPGEDISKSYTILVTYCKSGNSIGDPIQPPKVYNSIQENFNDKFDFTVYPNPNDGNFTIQLLDVIDMKPFSVQIFSSLGTLISKIERCNAYQINVNHTNLPSGTYYIMLTMGNNVTTKKIILQ